MDEEDLKRLPTPDVDFDENDGPVNRKGQNSSPIPKIEISSQKESQKSEKMIGNKKKVKSEKLIPKVVEPKDDSADRKTTTFDDDDDFPHSDADGKDAVPSSPRPDGKSLLGKASSKFKKNPFINRGSNIQVAVRVRPFNEREEGSGSTLCVTMPSATKVEITDEAEKSTSFEFTRTYFSHDPKGPTQLNLMEEIGQDLKKSVLDGINCCVYAYGQTGSGKTHTMLGQEKPKENRGLVPRVMKEILQFIEKDAQKAVPESNFQCRVSYLEIYHENLHDLLKINDEDEGKAKSLNVTQNPKLGIIIPNLTENAVATAKDVQKIIEYGSKARMVGSTGMNSRSSRSHCIFSLEMQQDWKDGGKTMVRRSKLQFVDLAGSEKQQKNIDKRKSIHQSSKDGTFINSSLGNLTQLINKIASTEKQKDSTTYKNCKLTLILSEALQGNYRTTMIATLAPGMDDIKETMSTLRVASQTQQINTNAVKNDIPAENLTKDISDECRRLKQASKKPKMEKTNAKNSFFGNKSAEVLDAEAAEQLEAAEWLFKKYSKDFKSDLADSASAQERRSEALKDMGLSGQEIAESMQVNKDAPSLVNLSDDPALNGALIYFIDIGKPTQIGSDKTCKIRLQGLEVKPIMCSIDNSKNKKLTLKPGENARVLVNGTACFGTERELKHHDRVILGHSHFFRVVIPLEAEKTQEELLSAKKELDKALGEVMAQDSPEYQQCRLYIGEVKTRIGEKRATKFLDEFGKHVPMIQEANAYASEMVPSERYVIKLEIMTDIYTYQTDEPELVFRFVQLVGPSPKSAAESGLAKVKNVLKKLDKKKTKTEEAQNSQQRTIALWDVSEFVNRLHHMRDVYEMWTLDGPHTVDFSKPEMNPWYTCGPLDVAQLMIEKDAERDFLEEQHIEEALGQLGSSLKNGNDDDNGAPDDFDLNSSPRGQISTNKNTSKSFNKVLEQVKTQKARIEELEKEVETLKNLQLAGIQAKMSDNGKRMPIGAAPGRIGPAEREELETGIQDLASRLKVLKGWGQGLAAAGTHNWSARLAEDQRSLNAFNANLGGTTPQGRGPYPGGGFAL